MISTLNDNNNEKVSNVSRIRLVKLFTVIRPQQ